MNNKGHDSRSIANVFVEKAQADRNASYPLTIMSLLKYVFFAHGWTLGNTGNPLICHTVQAWKYGPVVPEVYHAFVVQGILIEEKNQQYPEPRISQEEREIIDSVYEEYSKETAIRLSEITHVENAPWYKHRNSHYGEIPNSEIEKYYKGLVTLQRDSENANKQH